MRGMHTIILLEGNTLLMLKQKWSYIYITYATNLCSYFLVSIGYLFNRDSEKNPMLNIDEKKH